MNRWFNVSLSSCKTALIIVKDAMQVREFPKKSLTELCDSLTGLAVKLFGQVVR